MTLNVPEAEEQARAVQRRLEKSDMARDVEAASTAEDFLALAALAREDAGVLEKARTTLKLFRSYYVTDNLLGMTDPKTSTELVLADTTLAAIDAALANARAVGLLPARESAPAEPGKPE
jgi:hypothetical protein